MAEYLEREALLRELRLWHMHKTDSLPDHFHYTGIKAWLEALPAEDVQPVKHGRWIKARGSWCTPGGDPVWECSECGKGMHVYGIEHGTYGSDVADGQWVACPNCGADMREKS